MGTKKSLKSASTRWSPTDELGAFGATESSAIDWELNLRLEQRVIRPTALIIAWLSSLLQTFSSRTRNMTGARSQCIYRYLSVYLTSTKFEGLCTNLMALMATWWYYVHTFKVVLTFSKGLFIIALDASSNLPRTCNLWLSCRDRWLSWLSIG